MKEIYIIGLNWNAYSHKPFLEVQISFNFRKRHITCLSLHNVQNTEHNRHLTTKFKNICRLATSKPIFRRYYHMAQSILTQSYHSVHLMSWHMQSMSQFFHPIRGFSAVSHQTQWSWVADRIRRITIAIWQYHLSSLPQDSRENPRYID